MTTKDTKPSPPRLRLGPEAFVFFVVIGFFGIRVDSLSGGPLLFAVPQATA